MLSLLLFSVRIILVIKTKKHVFSALNFGISIQYCQKQTWLSNNPARRTKSTSNTQDFNNVT